ncbi:MAG: GTPase Era [Clostridia bacterium]|nr:GTPase Era [Clostridia bacterium]
MNNKFYSGFVSLVGRPNVGKSTLMNALVGEKIAIISPKPQTTRNKIQAILTHDDFQMIFIDTPGIHKPKFKLDNYMVKAAETTFGEVDAVLMLTEPQGKVHPADAHILERLKNVKTPVILIINKIDTADEKRQLETAKAYNEAFNFKEIMFVSATTGKNLDELLKTIKKYLPEGPKYFPEDMVTDQPERQIASEIIREKALQLLREEIPHGIAVEVSSMKKRPDRELVDVEATIFCEKDSHKGIIIGKGGNMLKNIGTRSREDISALLGSSVNLQLWVKVKKDWRDSDFLLKNFGYDMKKI